MPKPRGVTEKGGRSAASMQVIKPIDFRPKWHPHTLERAQPEIVATYLLSTKALQVLMGSELYTGEVLPVSERSVAGVCDTGRLDWINVGWGKRPTRAFNRTAVEAYFTYYRKSGVPWHRLPRDLREQLGIDLSA